MANYCRAGIKSLRGTHTNYQFPSSQIRCLLGRKSCQEMARIPQWTGNQSWFHVGMIKPSIPTLPTYLTYLTYLPNLFKTPGTGPSWTFMPFLLQSLQTGSSGPLIGWKSGQTTYFPLWDRMEGAWLWTQADRREKLCWVWRNRMKISQIIKDTFTYRSFS